MEVILLPLWQLLMEGSIYFGGIKTILVEENN